MLLWSMWMPHEPRDMTPEEVAVWEPDSGPLPRAGGKIMFRVDTTLDDPIRTSILCGACGVITWVEGPQPKGFNCPQCALELWVEPPAEEE